jgi:hypothetical protein
MVACIYHWYISMLYVVPVVGLGAWGWRASRRAQPLPEDGGPDEAAADDLRVMRLGDAEDPLGAEDRAAGDPRDPRLTTGSRL